MPKIMHKFLDKEDIIGNAATTNEGPLLRIDETRYNYLQPPDQDLRTDFTESDTEADQPKMAQSRCVMSLWDQSNQDFLLLNRNTRTKSQLYSLDNPTSKNGPIPF